MDSNNKKFIKKTNVLQIQKLVELMEENPQLATSSPTFGSSRLLVEETWDNVAKKINALGPPTRSGSEWKKKSDSKRETYEINLRKVFESIKTKGSADTRSIIAGVGCTSTPRKSKVHYDQRRLLDQFMASSPSSSPLSIGSKSVKKESEVLGPNISIFENPLTEFHTFDVAKASVQNKTIVKRLEAIAGGIKRCRRNSFTFSRRLSRRIKEICTPTSEETTSSTLSTPAGLSNKMKRQIIVSRSDTTSSGKSKTVLLQKRLQKNPRNQNWNKALYSKGSIYAKYRTPNKGVLHDMNRYKSRKQRLEHFNKGRNIKSFSSDRKEGEVDQTITCNDMKVIAKALGKGRFTFDKQQFEQSMILKEDCDNEKVDENVRYEFHMKQKESKQELISSQDLEDFDHYIARTKDETQSKKFGNEYSSPRSFQLFEQLLGETELDTPFLVGHICDKATKMYTRNEISLHYRMDSHNEHDDTSLATATPHLSPNFTTCHLPRTIYGGTVIYNHRLPNINKTYVRKSSIYVKSRKRFSHHHLESSYNNVVLITNQTINFVDIMCMWSQMDNTTRIIISFAILASFTTLLCLFVSFCSRR